MSRESSRTTPVIQTGATAPAFRGTDVEGDSISLADYRGKVVLLDFFATWCGPCRAEFRALVPWWRKATERGFESHVTVLAVDVQEPREIVQSFLVTTPLPFPVVLDDKGAIAGAYGVTVLPTLMFIDRRGRVRYTQQGYDPNIVLKLTALVDSLAHETVKP